MGCWDIAEDRIEITPKVNDALIREFIEFSIISCPVRYCTEKFPNPWFFDAENRLICCSGKFGEPYIWYEHLKKYFFRPRGYKLPDEITILAEYESNMWEIAEERAEEFNQWLDRRDELMKGIYEYESLFSFTGMRPGRGPLPAGFR